MCLYTGKCTKSALGNEGGKYTLSCQWFNDGSSEWEQWHIDSYEQMNAAGRFINDARNTQYTNNCTWDRNGLSNEPHAVVGKYYLGVYATRDIMQGEELFMSYGDEYWIWFEDTLRGQLLDRANF